MNSYLFGKTETPKEVSADIKRANAVYQQQLELFKKYGQPGDKFHWRDVLPPDIAAKLDVFDANHDGKVDTPAQIAKHIGAALTSPAGHKDPATPGLVEILHGGNAAFYRESSRQRDITAPPPNTYVGGDTLANLAKGLGSDAITTKIGPDGLIAPIGSRRDPDAIGSGPSGTTSGHEAGGKE